MPDVSGIAALDVLIGLFFLYFLLSVACSAVNELIAQLFNLRARTLSAGIRNLLDDATLTNNFFAHERLKALSKPAKGLLPARRPSYIPSRTFALTLLDTILPPAEGETNRDLVAVAREGLTTASVPKRVKTLLADALDEAGDKRDRLRAELERSFDEAMDRVSGWYKRRAQLILLVIALGVVGAANADSLVLAQRLWKDDALRAVVVTKATQTVRAGTQNCPDTDAQTPVQEQAAECLDAVEELGIPLGWTVASAPRGWWDILAKIGGLLVTAFMVSLGAPFWFDLLSKVARLRASGPPAPPTEKREADRPANSEELLAVLSRLGQGESGGEPTQERKADRPPEPEEERPSA
jgi:hypothetical protein